jgi:lipoprotein-anchoring transpeptidase ErfK/SrfK
MNKGSTEHSGDIEPTERTLEAIHNQGQIRLAYPAAAPPASLPFYKRKPVLLGSTAGLVLAVVIAGYFMTFKTSFMAGTLYAGTINATHLSDKQLAQTISQKQKDYRLVVSYPDQKEHAYSASQVGITLDAASTSKKIAATKQHLGFGRYAWWQKKQLPLSLHQDAQVMQTFIDTNTTAASVPAVDATLSIQNGAVVTTPEKAGAGYTLTSAKSTLANHISQLAKQPLQLKKNVIAANITQANLESAKHKAQTLLEQTVSLQLEDTTIPASKADIGSWLDVSPVPSAHTVDVSINSGNVQAFITKATKSRVTVARSQVEMTNADGTTSVLSAGQAGFDITNKADAAESIASQLNKHTGVASADLIAQHVPFTTVSATDQDKWIVVDVTTKRLYAYEHSTLVNTFLVSAGAPKTPTVLGSYKIYSKYASKDMRGNNADGSRYYQPHVQYVNFFYKDYAVHGNYWRPASYFGNINSSHGCVGLPDSNAKWVYDWAPIGTTVITHA